MPFCWRDDAVDCQTGTSGAVAEIDLPRNRRTSIWHTHTIKRQTAMFVSATFRAILEHFFFMVISRVPSSFCVFLWGAQLRHHITALQSTLLVNTRRALALFISTRAYYLDHSPIYTWLPLLSSVAYYFNPQHKKSEICRDQKESSLLSSAYSIDKLLQTFSLYPGDFFIMTLFKYLFTAHSLSLEQLYLSNRGINLIWVSLNCC